MLRSQLHTRNLAYCAGFSRQGGQIVTEH